MKYTQQTKFNFMRRLLPGLLKQYLGTLLKSSEEETQQKLVDVFFKQWHLFCCLNFEILITAELT